jgi:ferritin-like metal-binding protein YciE
MARTRKQQGRTASSSSRKTASKTGTTSRKTAAKSRVSARAKSSAKAQSARGGDGLSALKKDELVERLDRRLGRLKRDELEKLVQGVESGKVNLATVGRRSPRSASRQPVASRTPAVPTAQPRAASQPSPIELRSLNDVLMEQIEDLYSAEKQLVEALPKVARAASNGELREGLEHHLEETKGHVRRLEQIFGTVGISSPSEHCEGMEGLIREGEEIVSASGDPAAKDAALIAAAQRVEHYEIAAYGTARTLADELGLDEAKQLLNETLDEESNADELLTRLATGGVLGSGINREAAT